jgi:hypothetical protein
MAASLENARAVKARLSDEIGNHPQVNGIGITRVGGGFGVKVNLEHGKRQDFQVPDEIDGVRIRFEPVGPITKLSDS